MKLAERCPVCLEPKLVRHCDARHPSPTCHMLVCKGCDVTVSPHLGVANRVEKSTTPAKARTVYWDDKGEMPWAVRVA